MNTTPVAIIGAGPVGMALAALLAQYRIHSIVFDKAPHLLKKGSKACLIQGDILEILEKLGCADVIAEEGIHWRVAHTYLKNIELITQTYPERVGFSQFVNISQYRIEQQLENHLNASPFCSLLWQYDVKEIQQHEQSTTLSFSTPTGHYHDRFRYVIACDGVHSKMRELAGQEFSGYTHQNRFLITDIRAQIPLRKERHFWFDPPFHPGKQLVMHPQPNNIWRIDWQLEENADIVAEKENGQLDQRIRKVIGNIPYKIEWLSTYRFNQKVIDRFRIGNLFFAGDAAHSLPPYGSRGMNSGIQDADNLAWKLRWVLAGWSSDSLLDSYHDERRAAALENLRLTEATMKFIAPDARLTKVKRNLILFIARIFPSARGWIDHGKMAEPFTYAPSALIARQNDNNMAGRFVPDLKMFVRHKPTRLRKLLSHEFSCLFFTDRESLPTFMQLAKGVTVPFPVNFIAAVPCDGDTFPSCDGIILAEYDDIASVRQFHTEEPVCYIVRPDGHIAGQYPLIEIVPLNALLNRFAQTTVITDTTAAKTHLKQAS
jgi:2-polyprenyl-6-methoxyphenol hydroxylase-like FAD-dependent oxidoreductase